MPRKIHPGAGTERLSTTPKLGDGRKLGVARVRNLSAFWAL